MSDDTFDQLIATAAETNHGVITTAALARLHVPERLIEHRVRTGRWISLAPGVWRHPGTPVTWELQLTAGLTWLGPNSAVSHRAAAALHGLDGFAREPVEFLVRRKARNKPGRWTVHSTLVLPRTDTLVVEGFRVTSPTRTLIDLAGVGTGPAQLGDAIDDAIHRRLTSLPTLRRRITELRTRGRAGLNLLDDLLLDGGGHSRLERAFLRLMRISALPAPRCQVVHERDGVTVARVDFEWTGARLIVEVNGRRGHASERERAKDARRRNELQRQGFVVLEFTTSQVLGDESYVATTVREHLALPHHPFRSRDRFADLGRSGIHVTGSARMRGAGRTAGAVRC